MAVTVLSSDTTLISAIRVVDGFNPRTEMDQAKLEQLAESIKANGVLQPVLVRPIQPNEPGWGNGVGYELVAGHRRLAAAKLAGLEEIPVHVQDLTGAQLLAATAENVAREDLAPVDEAMALLKLQEETGHGVRELARVLGKGKDWVSDRLRLAKLPDPIREAVAAGDIGLHAVPQLARLEEHRAGLGAAILKLALAKRQPAMTRSLTPHDLEDPRELGHKLYWTCRGGGAAKLGMATASTDSYSAHTDPDHLPLEKDVIKQLEDELRKIGPKRDQYGYASRRRLMLGRKQIAAAREAGCLLELPGHNKQTHYFITDPEFVREEVWAQVQAHRKDAEREARKAEKAAAKAGATGVDDKQKAERRKERERQAREQLKAREHNLALGEVLREQFAKVQITADVARLFVQLALDDQRNGIGALAGRGLRYVDPALQEVEEKRNGSVKVTYLSPEKAKARIDELLAAAKSPQEIFGIALQVLAAARFADDRATAQSNRVAYYGGVLVDQGYYSSRASEERKMLEAIVAPALPEPLRPKEVKP